MSKYEAVVHALSELPRPRAEEINTGVRRVYLEGDMLSPIARQFLNGKVNHLPLTIEEWDHLYTLARRRSERRKFKLSPAEKKRQADITEFRRNYIRRMKPGRQTKL